MKTQVRQLLPFLLLLVLGAVVAGCGGSDDDSANAKESAKANDTVKVGYISAVPKPSGIESWGEQKQIMSKALASAGIGKLEFVRFSNGPDAGAAQASGAVDVALVGDLPGIATKASGIDTKLVAVSGTDIDAWLLAREGGPKTLQELAGKKVAVAKGSYMDKYLTALLKQEGLTDKVTVVNLLPPDALAALSSKNIDAYAGPPYYSDEVLAEKKITIIDRATDHGLGGIGTTTVRTEFADAHPGFTKAWNAGFVASRADALANSDAYYKSVADANGLTPDQAKVLFEINKTIPADQLDPDNVNDVKATAQFLLDNKLQTKLVDVDAWIDDPDAHGDAN